MMTALIFLIFGTIAVQQIVGAELSSTCVPSLTRPGRPLPCSTNLDCECFNLADDNTGICAAALTSCSSLKPCDLNGEKKCLIPDTVCITDSRCNQPVCYPLPLASPQVCPAISMIIPSTTTSAPILIKTTYPIGGDFNTIVITGTKFVIKFIQLFGLTSTPYLEILNRTNAPSPISLNSTTQTLTLANLNDVNIIVYFKTLKHIISNRTYSSISTIDIENLDATNITLASDQQANIIGRNQLNVSPGCCGITNISSLGNINVILENGGWPNVTAVGENVTLQVQSGIPKISIKAEDTANIFTNGISTCSVEAGKFLNINTKGIDTIYAKTFTSTMTANMTLNGIAKVYMSISNSNGTKIGYSCPKTVTMNMSPSSTVYVCATEKINVNGYGGYVYYQGSIIDTRTYGSKIPFV